VIAIQIDFTSDSQNNIQHTFIKYQLLTWVCLFRLRICAT